MPRGRQLKVAAKAAEKDTDSSDDSLMKSSVFSDSDDENRENVPPPPAAVRRMIMDDSDDDPASAPSEEVQRSGNIRARRRLSMRTAKPPTVPADGAPTGPELPRPDAETLKKVYASCLEMFQGHKITVENAFQIQFLELMGDIVESPGFNKEDMLGAGRLLEAGTRIYVCRVEKTKSTVLDLASTLKLKLRDKNRQRQGGEDGDEDQPAAVGMDVDPAMEFDDPEAQEERRRKNRRKRMKDRPFIADNLAKISMSLEVDSFKGGARRAALKAKFVGLIENGVDFDYYNTYLKSVDTAARLEEGEANVQDNVPGTTAFEVPSAIIDLSDIKSVEKLPFVLVEHYNNAHYDIWGKPYGEIADLAEYGEGTIGGHVDAPVMPEASPEIAEGIAFNPQDLPPLDNQLEDHPDLEEYRGFEHDTFVNDDGVADVSQKAMQAPRKFSSLDEFYKVFGKPMGNIFAMCGPGYVKTQRFNLVKAGAAPKKPRAKKEPVYIDFHNLDKKLTKFLTTKVGKTQFDERAVEIWSRKGRPRRPYLDMEECDEDCDELVALIDEAESKIPVMFKYIIDQRQNILGYFDEPVIEDDQAHKDARKEEDQYLQDAGFEVERDYSGMDDYMGEPAPDMGGRYSMAGMGEAELPPNVDWGSFPPSLLGNLMSDVLQGTATKTDTDSIRFMTRPKPIDMHALKRAIVQHLTETLKLNDDGTPALEEETRTDFLALLRHVHSTVDVRTAENLSISILVTGLLHVVADKKLFLDDKCAVLEVICRGKSWVHKDHIPMPFEVSDSDEEGDGN